MNSLPARPRATDPAAQRGTVLIIALISMVALATLIAVSLSKISKNFTTSSHASSWNDAMNGAESGVDIAMIALNANDWTGWTVNGSTKTYWPTLTHGGEGNNTLRMSITVDSPATLVDGSGQWYRIRSTGRAIVPGPRRLAYDPFDVRLRKVSLLRDRLTGAAVSQPEVMRTVEAIAQPLSLFNQRGLTLRNAITMSGGSWIDSFDSGDPTKSTNGLYDLAKRQSNGDIGVLDSTSSDLKNQFVYGDIEYSGPLIQNTGNVQGNITTPFSESVPDVIAPTWTPTVATPTSITGPMTLTGGPTGSPARYKLTQWSLSGSDSVTWAPHAAGQESYAEVWITGNMALSGSSFITQQPGLHVTYYIEGDVALSGSSFNNQSNKAANMAINLVNRINQKVDVSGSGVFIGTLNAPAAKIALSGSASFSGAFIGNTIDMSGGANLHYDESFRSGWGNGINYVLANWVEATQ